MLKALVKAHLESNSEQFHTLTLQIAAHEAKVGHIHLANELKHLIDREKTKKPKIINLNAELQGLILERKSNERLSDLVLSNDLIKRIQRIEREFIQREKLKLHGLVNRRKFLFAGPPGTGKTLTASVIAKELSMPLNIVLMDKLITKFMGESSGKLRQIFEIINDNTAVYLFDEFDAIGGERSKENDVGEMRRVLNSFLQFIEADKSDSIIIAITNNVSLLDNALFRRFDDVIKYELPSAEERKILLMNKLGSFSGDYNINEIVSLLEGLSHADITRACIDAVKETILSDRRIVEKSLLINMIKERQSVYNNLR